MNELVGRVVSDEIYLSLVCLTHCDRERSMLMDEKETNENENEMKNRMSKRRMPLSSEKSDSESRVPPHDRADVPSLSFPLSLS